ncbi:unnamed protein product [Acanthoscelides obtectus]|uniref:Uncharacterized protein n=1 Tax=Acanthoscelides obtectus TaxID=200917 RepID=A0A9P0JQF9_ACAOB|nr:unnamed protein product [Acanthoscelides obtectus]CAK1654346.1 hypothetical protein AOBTE_LOCUS18535 [Acanthoscelides obtectus]
MGDFLVQADDISGLDLLLILREKRFTQRLLTTSCQTGAMARLNEIHLSTQSSTRFPEEEEGKNKKNETIMTTPTTM